MTKIKYGQYREDIFSKLNFPFEKGKKILDLGCGDGVDSLFLREEYKLNVVSSDVYRHENIDKFNLNFIKASIYKLPFKSKTFDYVFMHDVLHHIDEPKQRHSKHIEGLLEVGRVIKDGGYLLIVEGNRYNPLFYPHMVKLKKHEHFKQSYFKNIVLEAFNDKDISFKSFESHLYPLGKNFIWKSYEFIMDNIIPKQFRAYNIAIVNF